MPGGGVALPGLQTGHTIADNIVGPASLRRRAKATARLFYPSRRLFIIFYIRPRYD